jgi:hypothetical protein
MCPPSHPCSAQSGAPDPVHPAQTHPTLTRRIPCSQKERAAVAAAAPSTPEMGAYQYAHLTTLPPPWQAPSEPLGGPSPPIHPGRRGLLADQPIERLSAKKPAGGEALLAPHRCLREPPASTRCPGALHPSRPVFRLPNGALLSRPDSADARLWCAWDTRDPVGAPLMGVPGAW